MTTLLERWLYPWLFGWMRVPLTECEHRRQAWARFAKEGNVSVSGH